MIEILNVKLRLNIVLMFLLLATLPTRSFATDPPAPVIMPTQTYLKKFTDEGKIYSGRWAPPGHIREAYDGILKRGFPISDDIRTLQYGRGVYFDATLRGPRNYPFTIAGSFLDEEGLLVKRDLVVLDARAYFETIPHAHETENYYLRYDAGNRIIKEYDPDVILVTDSISVLIKRNAVSYGSYAELVELHAVLALDGNKNREYREPYLEKYRSLYSELRGHEGAGFPTPETLRKLFASVPQGRKGGLSRFLDACQRFRLLIPRP